jgi:hypothetical protein
MDKPAVMFDRALRPEWVDYALEKYVNSADEATLRGELCRWLEIQGFGKYTVSKTALQLQRTVGYRSSFSRDELESFYSEMLSLPTSQRDNLRLDVLFKSNDFIRTLFEMMKRSKLNGTVGLSVQQLYERLQAEYGHRGMIPRRVRYALQTLVSFGVVEHQGRLWSAK